MIQINQRASHKSIGETSLFLNFEYNSKVIDIVKGSGNAIYNKNSHEWEVPLCSLSYLIDNLTYIDDIELSLLPSIGKNKITTCLQHKTPPFKYQQEGIEWLINRNSGLLLDLP